MCGRTSDEVQLEVDHVIPFSKGGKTTIENGQTLCLDCNKGKDTKQAGEDTDIEKENGDLIIAAREADLNYKIHRAKVEEEHAKQEEIKTLEIKKELAPVSLLKYFLSFTESLIQRLHRRPHEIIPQVMALCLAGEDKKAVDLIKREQEAIIKQVVGEFMKAVEDEGYNVSDTK